MGVLRIWSTISMNRLIMDMRRVEDDDEMVVAHEQSLPLVLDC